jgi:hypothetical protein
VDKPSPITHDKFPEQSSWLGRDVLVCFDYDTAHTISGVIVRCDAVEPGKMIIYLGDGRYVLSTECQYSFPPGEKAGGPSPLGKAN